VRAVLKEYSIVLREYRNFLRENRGFLPEYRIFLTRKARQSCLADSNVLQEYLPDGKNGNIRPMFPGKFRLFRAAQLAVRTGTPADKSG